MNKHGKWMQVYTDNKPVPIVYCSECQAYTNAEDNYPYCPYCGCKMDLKKGGDGKWIEVRTDSEVKMHKCSECGGRTIYSGTIVTSDGKYINYYRKDNYCSVCGARMDKK